MDKYHCTGIKYVNGEATWAIGDCTQPKTFLCETSLQIVQDLADYADYHEALEGAQDWS